MRWVICTISERKWKYRRLGLFLTGNTSGISMTMLDSWRIVDIVDGNKSRLKSQDGPTKTSQIMVYTPISHIFSNCMTFPPVWYGRWTIMNCSKMISCISTGLPDILSTIEPEYYLGKVSCPTRSFLENSIRYLPSTGVQSLIVSIYIHIVDGETMRNDCPQNCPIPFHSSTKKKEKGETRLTNPWTNLSLKQCYIINLINPSMLTSTNHPCRDVLFLWASQHPLLSQGGQRLHLAWDLARKHKTKSENGCSLWKRICCFLSLLRFHVQSQ